MRRYIPHPLRLLGTDKLHAIYSDPPIAVAIFDERRSPLKTTVLRLSKRRTIKSVKTNPTLLRTMSPNAVMARPMWVPHIMTCEVKVKIGGELGQTGLAQTPQLQQTHIGFHQQI